MPTRPLGPGNGKRFVSELTKRKRKIICRTSLWTLAEKVLILTHLLVTKTVRTVNRTANKVFLLTNIWKKDLRKIQFLWNEMKLKNASRYSNMQCNAKKLIVIRSHVQSKYIQGLYFQGSTDAYALKDDPFVRKALVFYNYNGWVHDESTMIFGSVDNTVWVSSDGISNEQNSYEFTRIFHLRFHFSWVRL